MERETCDKELQLEAALEAALAPSPATTSVATLAPLVTSLEASRGRQQRAGWGQSDFAWDLPFTGAWDVLFSSDAIEQTSREYAQLESSRQWVYGPGDGGVGIECIVTSQVGRILVTHSGSLIKQAGDALEVTLGSSRTFQLKYTTRTEKSLQQADGSWATVVVEEPSAIPTVLPLQPSGGESARRLCSPRSGLSRTTYLSDTLWIVRSETAGPRRPGAFTILRRTEAEALRPDMNAAESPDGFDARRFGPSGRRMWMLDATSSDESQLGYERARQRMRTADDISRS